KVHSNGEASVVGSGDASEVVSTPRSSPSPVDHHGRASHTRSRRPLRVLVMRFVSARTSLATAGTTSSTSAGRGAADEGTSISTGGLVSVDRRLTGRGM